MPTNSWLQGKHALYFAKCQQRETNKFKASRIKTGITAHASPSIRVCRKLLTLTPSQKLAQIILCHTRCSQFKCTTSGLPRDEEGLNKMLLAPLHCPDTVKAKPKLQQPQTSHTGACCTSPGARTTGASEGHIFKAILKEIPFSFFPEGIEKIIINRGKKIPPFIL